MTRRSLRWWVMTVLALTIAAYAVTLAIVGEPMYPEALRRSFLARPWGLFVHALGSAVALAIGPFQLDRRLLVRRRRWHRNLGKVYVGAAPQPACGACWRGVGTSLMPSRRSGDRTFCNPFVPPT